jgi:DNA-binding beta-propeller fold protein YncE
MKLLPIALFSIFFPIISLSAAEEILTKEAPIAITNSHGGFDFIEIDQAKSRLLLPHSGNGTLDFADSASGRFIKSVPTGVAQDVAIDAKGGRYYVSVSKGSKLVSVDSSTLEIVGETPLPGPADIVAFDPQNSIAYDSALNRVYCASGSGVLSVVDAAGDLKLLGTVTTQKGAHSVAVDQKSHAVGIAYSAGKDAPGFIQKLK